jgi:colanic acid biosynthesis glycosyl transferase WcaI
MRILLYSISYSPEIAGSGRYNGELTEWLAEQGHQVDVITAHPYYPEWRVRDEYRNRYWLKEKKNNLTIYRAPLYVPKKVTGKTRVIHELSFVFSSIVHWVRLAFVKYDAIIAVCPPFHIGVFPYLLSCIKNIPFVFHIQDLQVDAARELGLIKNEKLLNFLDGLEKFLLVKATKVSSISEGMKRNIIGKGVRSENYFMLPNWVDIALIKPLLIEQSLKAKLGFQPTDKIALYSGNIGEKQGLEILPEVARLLQDRPNIKIVIFGEGAARSRLVELTKDQQLNNIFLYSPVENFEDVPKVLAMADVHLVIQRRAASDLVMPSKLVTILAAGGASIVSADKGTSLSDVIVENQLGWTADPENASALAETIKKALDSSILPDIRKNARTYAEKYLDKQVILSKYESMLKLLTQPRQTH